MAISSKRSIAKVSNICIAPVDTSGSVSQQSSVIGSIDEGGFNEPSPEIKAKLKPAYSFETTTSADASVLPEKRDDFNENDYNAHQHSLHYVDFGYRLNPDGSESKQCFSEESDEYVTAKSRDIIAEHETVTSNVVLKKTTVHYPVADSVVYASIKSEPTSLSPPPPPPLTDRNYCIEDDYANDVDNVSDIDEKFEGLHTAFVSFDRNRNNPISVHSKGCFEPVRTANGEDDEQAAIDLDNVFEQIYTDTNVDLADAGEKDGLPDAMTSYEADRLLSSRWVSLNGHALLVRCLHARR